MAYQQTPITVFAHAYLYRQPYQLKQAGIVDADIQKNYSAALSKYLLEQDENLLDKPRTKLVLKGAIDEASDGDHGVFTLPNLAKTLVRGGIYATVAVPTVKSLGVIFNASAPVQKRLTQLGVLGSAVGGIASVLNENDN